MGDSGRTFVFSSLARGSRMLTGPRPSLHGPRALTVWPLFQVFSHPEFITHSFLPTSRSVYEAGSNRMRTLEVCNNEQTARKYDTFLSPSDLVPFIPSISSQFASSSLVAPILLKDAIASRGAAELQCIPD